MVDRDVVTAKISTLERCLTRIADARDEKEKGLRADYAEAVVELNLQRAIQAVLGLAIHAVTAERYGIPDSAAGAFALLAERKVIDPDLAGRLRKLAGFRNIFIHEYREVDPAIVEGILTKRLDDLRAFAARVISFYGLA